MIRSHEELEAIAHLDEGLLSDHSFATLLSSLWMAERTVALEVRHHQLQKQIVLENGIPIEAASNLLHETIGKFLVQRGTISEEVYLQCLVSASDGERSMEDVLVSNGCINHFDLFKMMQQNLAQKLLDCFAWRDGSFLIHTNLPEVPSPLKVKVPQLILTGVASFTAQEEVDAAIVPLIGKRIVAHPTPHVDAASMKLNTKQSRLLLDIGQGARIDELSVESQLAPDEVTRLVYSLGLLGAIILEDDLPAASAPPERAISDPRLAQPVAQESNPQPEPESKTDAVAATEIRSDRPSAAELEALRDEIMQLYLEHRRKDSFELLGLTIDAKPAAIASAYVQYSQKYAPWVFEEGELEGLTEKAQDLFLAGARAYAELIDSSRRRAVIEKRHQSLRKPTKQEKKSPQDFFAIKTDLLDSEAQYEKGLKLIAAGDFDAAIPLLEFAVDCDPHNAGYAAELAFCRYQANANVADASLAELRDAVRGDPDCGVALYYLGELARLQGDAKSAEPNLRRACKLMKGDRRPTESLKLLLTKKR